MRLANEALTQDGDVESSMEGALPEGGCTALDVRSSWEDAAAALPLAPRRRLGGGAGLPPLVASSLAGSLAPPPLEVAFLLLLLFFVMVSIFVL